MYSGTVIAFVDDLLSRLLPTMFVQLVFIFWPIPLLLLVAPLTQVRASHPQLRAPARLLLKRGAARCSFVLGIWGLVALDIEASWCLGSALVLVGYASMLLSLNRSINGAEEYVYASEYLLPAVSVGLEGVMIIEHVHRSKNRPRIG